MSDIENERSVDRLGRERLTRLVAAAVAFASVIALAMLVQARIDAVAPIVLGGEAPQPVVALRWSGDGNERLSTYLASGRTLITTANAMASPLENEAVYGVTIDAAAAGSGAAYVQFQGRDARILAPGRLFAFNAASGALVTQEPAPMDYFPENAPRPLPSLLSPGGIRHNRPDGRDLVSLWDQQVTSIVAMPDGVALGGASGGVARDMGGKRLVIANGGNPIRAIAAADSPDAAPGGAHLAVMDSEGRIRVWRLNGDSPGTPQTVFFANNGSRFTPESLDLSAGGETLSIQATNGIVYVARLNEMPADTSAGGEEMLFIAALVKRTQDVQVLGEQAAQLRAALPDLPLPAQPVETWLQALTSESSGPAYLEIARSLSHAAARQLHAHGGPLIAIYPQDLAAVEVPLQSPGTASRLSRDGKRLFSAGTDCLIREIDLTRIFDPVAGERVANVLATLSGHGALVSHLALSRTGRHLAAADLNGRVRIHWLDSTRFISAMPLALMPTGPECVSQQPVTIEPPPPMIPQVTPPVADNVPATPEPVRNPQRVFVQFAGAMTRKAVVEFSQGLVGQGWRIQGADRGGERLSQAAGYNEVRYRAQADRAAAEELAKQASAARSGTNAGPALTVIMSGLVEAGDLEIWMSN